MNFLIVGYFVASLILSASMIMTHGRKLREMSYLKQILLFLFLPLLALREVFKK